METVDTTELSEVHRLFMQHFIEHEEAIRIARSKEALKESARQRQLDLED